MSMCAGRSKGRRGECLREVADGSLIQLCDICLLVAEQEIEERGGSGFLKARVRESLR